MPDITKVPDDELLAMDSPDEDILLKTEVANNPLASINAYAANIEQSIPFLHQLGSGLASSLGYGEGPSFMDRYKNLEQSQNDLRNAGMATQPHIKTPSYLPDITPVGVGTLGAGMATSPIGGSRDMNLPATISEILAAR